MSSKDVPWLITINDKSNIAELSKRQKLYYTLNVMNVEDKSKINDKNNKSLCVIPLFKSHQIAQKHDINVWNSLMNKTYIYDAFKSQNSHCIYMKQLQHHDSLFAIHIEDDMIEYIQLDQENDNIMNLILMNNSYLYYVSNIIELNGTLTLHGVLLNPLSDLESIHDDELFRDLKMDYLENMFKL
jgi:hypothetical protein